MKKKITFVLGIICTTVTLQAVQEKNLMLTSSYSSIDQRDCVTLDSDNLGSVQECEPFGHIGVKVIEGDMRQSIVLMQNRKEYDLDFTKLFSASFPTLGSQIEWRHELGKPENVKGMIVKLDVHDTYDNFAKVHSYLLVAKIMKQKICLVAKILPQRHQNKLAREILDRNKPLPCLKKPHINNYNKTIKCRV